MNRKEFLLLSAKGLFLPFLFFLTAAYAVYFLYSAAVYNDGERALLLIVAGFIVLLVVLEIVKRALQKTYEVLPQKAKQALQIGSKLIDFLAPVAFGMVLYKAWEKDPFLAAMVFVYLVASAIYKFRKENLQDK